MADTKVSGLPAASAALAAQELPVNDAGTSRKLTVAQIGDYLNARISGSSGAAGDYVTLQRLSSNAAANSTTTFATVMTTTGVGAGTWKYEYFVLVQTSANTVGIKFQVGHTGTTSPFIAHEWFANDASTASTAVMADTASTAAGVTGTNYLARVSNGALGVPTGTVNGLLSIFVVFRGLFICTVSGNLTLDSAAETAGTNTTVQAGTNLVLTKIA